MRKDKSILTLVLLLSVALTSYGQSKEDGRDNFTLLTMPFNLRQLTLYRGQFTVDAGYKFAVRSVSYDDNGNKVILTNSGGGSVYHYYYTDIKYGVTNFLEVGAETYYLRHGIRTQTEKYISTTTSGNADITLNQLQELKGFGDVLLIMSLRPPMKYRGFDFRITGGLFLPVSGYKPDLPSNTVTTAAANSYVINSYTRYANGYGVPVYLLSGSMKAGIKKFTFEADFSFRTPKKEGTNIRWTSTIDNAKVSYNDKSYSYLLSNEFHLDASLHYQASGWFDVYLNADALETRGGWTEYWGNKYSNKQTMLVNIEPCFEIQISPSLRICQVAGFPLKGKNSDASFYMFTTIKFSRFLSGNK